MERPDEVIIDQAVEDLLQRIRPRLRVLLRERQEGELRNRHVEP